MTSTKAGKDERMFVVELRSKDDIRNVSLDRSERVVVEGSLGALQRARFLEGPILEVIGSAGELRLDLAPGDLELISKTTDRNDDQEVKE